MRGVVYNKAAESFKSTVLKNKNKQPKTSNPFCAPQPRCTAPPSHTPCRPFSPPYPPLQFDGWLVNVESNIRSGQLPNLRKFLSALTSGMHTAVPGSQVVWYDAVSAKDGLVKYQNCLNSNNMPFFDICDGIFLNYGWKPNELLRSKMNAGERAVDVYAGIDVFGRETFGGGGWTCDVATAEIKKAGVSCAVFAPGWVFEDEQFEDKSKFDYNLGRFWHQFECFRSAPLSGLPFCTSFDAGRGIKCAIEGRTVDSSPWANLSCIGIHPTFTKSRVNPYFLGGGLAEWSCLPPSFELQYNTVFEGGAALRFTDSGPITAAAIEAAPKAVYRLYSTDLSLSSPLFISFTFYETTEDGGIPVEDLVEPVLTLYTAGDGEPSTRYLSLAPPTVTDPSATLPEAGTPAAKLFERYGVVASRTERVEEATTTFSPSTNLGNLCNVVRRSSCSSSKWQTRGYILCDKALKFRTVSEIRLSLKLKPSAKGHLGKSVSFVLGQIQITKVSSLARIPTKVPRLTFSRPRWHEIAHENVWRLGGILEWGALGEEVDAADYFEVWAADGEGEEKTGGGGSYVDVAESVNMRYVCRVHGCTARTRVVVNPSVNKTLRLFVKPVTAAGLKPALSECASITLTF